MTEVLNNREWVLFREMAEFIATMVSLRSWDANVPPQLIARYNELAELRALVSEASSPKGEK